jgi:hypothetical protein
MKKTVLVLVSLFAISVGACSQLPGLTPTPGTVPSPTINPDNQFQTAVAQTLTAQPTIPSGSATETPVSASPTSPANTETPTLVASPVVANTDTPTLVASPTLVVDLSATAGTATSNVPTATSFPSNFTPTVPPASGAVTPIWTLAVRTYGTLPPAVPSSEVTLVNRADAEAYISLQVTMPDGQYSIIEYPVEGRISIRAPVGSYLYVAWVGGRKLVGEFRLSNDNDITITLFRNRVEIR